MEAHLFSNKKGKKNPKKQTGMDLGGWVVGGLVTIIKIYYMKKSIFTNKKFCALPPGGLLNLFLLRKILFLSIVL